MPPAAAKSAPSAAAEKPEKAAGSSSKLQKPDQVAYNKEQDEINKDIEAVKEKLNQVRSKLALLHSPAGNENDRRSQIRAEMDSLQGAQGSARNERTKTLDQVKRLQEGVQQKIKDIQAQRQKLPYKNAEDIDQRIAQLNKQVESGQLKLIDEKKALAEITSLKRSKKQVEATASVEESIAADRAKIDELRKVLDDPENKKTQARWEELKSELDALRAEGNKAYEERSALFSQRTDYQKELDELYGKKRSSAQKFREEGDAYWARVQEERKAKQERFRQQKAEEDAARREEEIQRLREDAKAPAYSREIEDCGVLIGWFEGKFQPGKIPATHAGIEDANQSSVIDGVKKLEIRKVEDEPVGTVLKKKNEDEEGGWGSFGGGGKKKKGGAKKAAPAASETPAETPAASGSSAVNLPYSLLTAILALSIPPPSSKDDVPRTIEDLKTKKAWFEANQERKTKEEIERVEGLVKKLQKKSAQALGEAGGKKEPLHTIAIAGDAKHDVVAEQGEQLPSSPEENKKVDGLDGALEKVASEEQIAQI